MTISNEKIRVTVDGEPVTREVSLRQVRAYLSARGWAKSDDHGWAEVWRRSRGSVWLYVDHEDSAYMLDCSVRDVARTEQRHPAEVLREIAGDAVAINAILPCPRCGLLHVDGPEPDTGWTNPPHKSHLCHGCGTLWRPADVPTNGVIRIATRGNADTWEPGGPYGGRGDAERPATVFREPTGEPCDRPIGAEVYDLVQSLIGLLDGADIALGPDVWAKVDAAGLHVLAEQRERRLASTPLSPHELATLRAAVCARDEEIAKLQKERAELLGKLHRVGIDLLPSGELALLRR